MSSAVIQHKTVVRVIRIFKLLQAYIFNFLMNVKLCIKFVIAPFSVGRWISENLILHCIAFWLFLPIPMKSSILWYK